MIRDIFFDALRNAVLISGLVIIMMMMIESLNIESKGSFFAGLRQSRVGGVLVGALLGAIPGCMGGFATVSLYTHGLLSFGALIAMMIASSGDEAFVMLAAFPQDALWIFALLTGIAVVAGLLTDLFVKKTPRTHCGGHYEIHAEDVETGAHHHEGRHFSWKRCLMFIGVAAAIGIIPESGPHMVFVTLYATGVVPLPVLLASCISQDGHASLPLIAESKGSFVKAKIINCAAALAVGFATMLFC